jgi:hypothetical protein
VDVKGALPSVIFLLQPRKDLVHKVPPPLLKQNGHGKDSTNFFTLDKDLEGACGGSPSCFPLLKPC